MQCTRHTAVNDPARFFIRSTEQGAKGAQELKKFVEEFESHRDSDYQRITAAGGEVTEVRWVRRDEPYATLVKARFPTAAALENFSSIKRDNGDVVAQARFIRDGNRRRFSIVISVPRDEKSDAKVPPSYKELREQQANVISETRLVVVGGKIIDSQGFVVSSDKRSCLLDSSQIDELLRSHREQMALFIVWELDGE